ncbi:DUF7827 domain-containing protein [Halosegnis rubeus]|uniref:PGF-CTERM sorting domain-containing protein n=1 Tax=Halosegnis rubeus TaxID=2212850 RepID=A0A5N5UMS0_9EURY|nr:BGTF surface domain-containing protein [Halosegnis rubeus]KAB7518633.1 PGF-CTERM sorting domain-containing protein [Halosegnis rubeus]
MTDTNTKVRSLILTALMVVSVFGGTIAFAGSAAAANEVSVNGPFDEDTVVAPSHTGTFQSVDDTVQYVVIDLTAADSGLNEPDLSAVTASDVQITKNGVEYTDGFSEFQKNSQDPGTITIKMANSINVVGGDTLDITVNDVLTPSVSGTKEYSVETTYYDTAGVDSSNVVDESFGPTNYDVTETSTSGGGGSTTLTGDAKFDSGSNAWIGQSLYFQADVADSGSDGPDTYELHEVDTSGSTDKVGTLVTEVALNSNGAALIDTSNLQGPYVMVDENGDVIATDNSGVEITGGNTAQMNGDYDDGEEVTVITQNFDAVFEASSATQGGDFDVTYTSNRAGYDVTVDSDDLSNEEIKTLFGASDSDLSDGVQITVTGNDQTQTYSVPSDFTTGNYSFTFEVADTTNSASGSIMIQSPSDTSASFASSAFSQERGDVVEFTVDMSNTQTADITVGSETVNYVGTATITDGNDDGSVTVQMNTFLAGTTNNEAQAFSAADSGDSVTKVRRSTSELDSPLAAADYDLTVSISGNEEDVAVFSLQPRSTTGAVSHTAPGDATASTAADYEDAAGVVDAATQRSTVAMGDQMIFQVNANGLYGYVDSASDLQAGSGNGVSLSVEQTGDLTNQAPKTVPVGNTEVYFDSTNDTFLVVYDTNDGAMRNSQSVDFSAGEEYTAEFVIDGDNNPYVATGETETVSSSYMIEERTVSFDTNADDEISVAATSDATISGETTMAPGTEFTVRARASGSSPFLKTGDAVVGSEGDFSSAFDFSGVSENTTFTVTVPSQGLVNNAETDGVVTNETDTETPTPTPTPEPATETPTPTPTPEPATETPTPTPEPATETPTEGGATPTETSGSQPGFGGAVAIVALAGAALIALRRGN